MMLLRERCRTEEKFPTSPQGQSGNKSLLLPRGNSDVPRITIRHLQRAESVSERALLRVRFTCRIPKSCRGSSSLDTPPPPFLSHIPLSFSSSSSCFSSSSPPDSKVKPLSGKKNRYTYLKYSTYLSALRLDDARGVAGHRLRGSRATTAGQDQQDEQQGESYARIVAAP